jgi:hypothetical protein
MKGTKQVITGGISLLYEYSPGIISKVHGIGKLSKIKKILESIKKTDFLYLKTVKEMDQFYIDKIINTPRFIGVWHEAFVLGNPKAISKIYKLRK